MIEDILLVEPDFVWQDMLSRHLREWGLIPCICPTASQALAAASGLRPFMAVVELDLPDMDGMTLIRILRSTPPLAALPVVILTRRRERATVEAALENAVSEYLVKSEHAPVQIIRRIAQYAGIK